MELELLSIKGWQEHWNFSQATSMYIRQNERQAIGNVQLQKRPISAAHVTRVKLSCPRSDLAAWFCVCGVVSRDSVPLHHEFQDLMGLGAGKHPLSCGLQYMILQCLGSHERFLQFGIIGVMG